jgi:tetratricopeptide (TPR) repeat protein
MIETGRAESADRGKRRPILLWSTVIRWGSAIGLPIVIIAFLSAVDPWLAQLPREPGRRGMELFLRSVLIGYLAILLVIPVGLGGSFWMIRRARRRGRSSAFFARIALLSGATALAVVALELTAAAWLSWEHRMPVLPTRFPEQSKVGELSLVVLGGSSAMGYPYSPLLSIGQIVSWQIEEALPGCRVHLDIRANLGRNLEDQHQELSQVKRRPDLVIVYSGHNEFLSRFDGSRDAGYAEAPTGVFLLGVYQLSLHSPFCRWIYETVRQHRVGGPPPSINQHHLIDVPMYSPSEYFQIVVDFRRRLEAITSYCEQIGAVAVLVIPPGNESGFEPNRSLLPAHISVQEREDLTSRYFAARAREASSPAESMKQYRSLIEEHPDFAESHFRLARLLDEAGKYEEARDQYIKARDLDGFPVRCRTEFMQIYRDVAAHHDCILIDGPGTFRAKSRHGILDDVLLHDAHHPTFAGHLTLAQAIMNELYKRRALGLGSEGAQAPVIDPAECLRYFEFDYNGWVLACVRSSMYYKHLSATRFDSAEREAKRDRWERAGEDIRAQRILPELAGVPGIGLPPPVPNRLDWWLDPPPTTQAQSARVRTDEHSNVR